MAEERLSYTIPADAAGNPGRQVDLDVTYDPGTADQDGYVTATAVSGSYQTIDSNGDVIRGDTVEGLGAAGSSFGSPDNKVFVGDGSPFVTSNGVTFYINNSSDSNDGSGAVNFYTSDGKNYYENGADTGPASAVSEAPVACFASGTFIRTTLGDVAVERLKVGDVAVTSSGAHRSIRWIGCQMHRLWGPMQPRSVWPVRIAAGAFGNSKPSAELLLSPGHSVCLGLIDEVLVPIQELVNGSTIAYVDTNKVTYWHVELDSHDILIANNMPAESFLEMGTNRSFFENGSGSDNLSAEVVERTHADFCRRFVDSGALLTSIRDELAIRAERLGWTSSYDVAIRCIADGRVVAGRVSDGKALFGLPTAAEEVRIASGMLRPALQGGADPRHIGLAVYAITITSADGEKLLLDLDGPTIASCFHPGEREEGLHYRWSSGDIVVPSEAIAGLVCPLLLELRYEPGTVRSWMVPASEPRVKLRLVG